MIDKGALLNELEFKAVRSSGSGGQHVNKTSTKVELRWDLNNSNSFSENEKLRIKSRLKSKLTNDYRLILQCGDTRSQHKNKELIINRFFELLEKGLKKRKKRKPTKPPKAVKQKRLAEKKRISEKKENRKPPEGY